MFPPYRTITAEYPAIVRHHDRHPDGDHLHPGGVHPPGSGTSAGRRALPGKAGLEELVRRAERKALAGMATAEQRRYLRRL